MKVEPSAEMEALLAQAGWLRRFARALVENKDDAEDLAQETLATAWKRSAGGGRAWLATVARNLAISRFRGDSRRRRREEVVQDPDAGRVATPEELIGDAQIHRRVAEAVVALDEPFRQTLVLRFYEGLAAVEIARTLGVPEGTIRWRVKEGLDRVRRALDVSHGDSRRTWVAALMPLLTQPKETIRIPRPRASPGISKAPMVMHLAAISVGLTSLVCIAAVTCSTTHEHRPAEMPPAPTEIIPEPRPSRPVRLALPNPIPPSTAPPHTLPPGPGLADATSLAEELLQAIRANDYDAFVAKGSASFRLAVATDGFAGLSAKTNARLSQAYRVSALGTVRRLEHVDWIFKIEFPDGGDDILLTLPLDGWQVAGFLFHVPFPVPLENTP